MIWATPMLAALVAAIAIPALVILYFLKLRRIPREVSSTLLWKKAIQDLQANAPFSASAKTCCYSSNSSSSDSSSSHSPSQDQPRRHPWAASMS